MSRIAEPQGRRASSLAGWQELPAGPLARWPAGLLLDDVRNRAGADRAAAFTNREARALFERDGRNQLHADAGVVARHDHLDAFVEIERPGHVRGAEVE